MEITGSHIIPAAPRIVWNALTDPAVLEGCLPGCESVERIDDDRFRVTIATVVGPLRARFNGSLCITEADPPRSCVMSFEGQGVAGFAKGSTSVALEELPEGTELAYTAKAQVGGKLAQVGTRIVDAVAKKLADDFFVAFCAQLETSEATGGSRDEHVSTDAQQRFRGAAHAGVSQTASTAPARTPMSPSTHVMVPGWWLAVAVILGSLSTVLGVLLLR